MTSQAKARAAGMQALLNDDGTVTPTAQLPDTLLAQEIKMEAKDLEMLLVADIYNNIDATYHKI